MTTQTLHDILNRAGESWHEQITRVTGLNLFELFLVAVLVFGLPVAIWLRGWV